MNAVEVFKDELKKTAKDDSRIRRLLHHPASMPLAAATGLAATAYGLHEVLTKGDTLKVHLSGAAALAPVLGLLLARKLAGTDTERTKYAEEESGARKMLHSRLARLVTAIPPAVMLGWDVKRLHGHFASGGKWGNLPEVPLGVPAHLAVSLGPMLGLDILRRIFPKESEKTAEMGIIKNPVRPSYPEFRAADPVYRQTPRERPVKAFMLR